MIAFKDGKVNLRNPIELHPNESGIIEGTLGSDIFIFDGSTNLKIFEPVKA